MQGIPQNAYDGVIDDGASLREPNALAFKEQLARMTDSIDRLAASIEKDRGQPVEQKTFYEWGCIEQKKREEDRGGCITFDEYLKQKQEYTEYAEYANDLARKGFPDEFKKPFYTWRQDKI